MKRLRAIFFLSVISHAIFAADVDLTKINFEEKIGTQLPAHLVLTDDGAHSHALSAYLAGKPAVLLLYYSTCPNLCDLVINGAIKSLRQIPQELGRDFVLIALSIDPNETNEALRAKKALFMKRYGKGNEQDAYFLKGSAATIKNVTDAVGFHYVYDFAKKQFAHPSGIVIINPKARVFQYFFGIAYDPKILSKALVAARTEERGTWAQRILLFCYSYDPLNGSWGSFIINTLRAVSVAFLLIGTAAFVFMRRKRKANV